MIVEHEVIEQIELEEHGRPLSWVCGADDAGHEMPRWKCAESFRIRDESLAIRVLATDLGSRWVHGP